MLLSMKQGHGRMIGKKDEELMGNVPANSVRVTAKLAVGRLPGQSLLFEYSARR